MPYQDIFDQRLPRRNFLGQTGTALTAGTLIGSSIFGCHSPTEKPKETTPDSPSVPLRIAILGQAAEIETLQRSWSAVSDQPLEITHTDLDRSKAINASAFLQSAKRCDVIIYPMALMGEAAGEDFVTEFSDDDLEAIRQTAGDLSVSLRNAMRFAGRNFAVPLGARQPVLMSSLNAERFENWSQYDQWVQKEAAGKASEPLASGWAAAMFLWRAAATTQGTWLFGRENLEPVLKDESYVDVLHQMQQTATRYPSGRLSPEEIWASLSKGNLKVAIGFPFGQITDGLSLSDLPSEYDPPRVLLDLFTPVVSISNGCRQSAAAKKFIAWLCGGDGSENLRRQIPSMTITRSPRLTNESNASTEQDGDYDAWLRNRLKTTMTLPVIQLNAATEYYRVLDEQVGRCLDGKAKPAEALNDAAKQWQEITQTQGVEIQMRQWRRCQGMRA